MVRALELREGLVSFNALFQINNRRPDAAGITFAALRHVKIKLNWGFAFAFGLLRRLLCHQAPPRRSCAQWHGWKICHRGIAVAANALTIVP